MKKENDNIEQFFKKNMSSQNFDFDEAQWLDLEHKMDATGVGLPPVPPKSSFSNFNYNILSVFIATAAIAFILGWYIRDRTFEVANSVVIDNKTSGVFLKNDVDSTKSYSNPNLKENNQSSSKKPIDINIEVKENLKENARKTHDFIPNETPIALTIEKVDVVDLQNTKRESQENTTTNLIKNKLNSIPTNSFKDDKRIRDTNNYQVGKKIDAKREYVEMKNDKAPENLNAPIDKSHIAIEKKLKGFTDFTHKEITLPSPNIFLCDFNYLNTKNKSKLRNKDLEKLGILFLLAPDFNSTSLDDLFSSVGQSVGIGIEYNLSINLRLGIGSVLNRKKYTAKSGEHIPVKGFWTNGIAPDNTDGMMLALDIPISLGYKIYKGARNSSYINAGISSYWLLSEQYDFNYNNNNSDLVQSWSGHRESFHTFGALNLSFTYEHRLNQNLSFRVAPYFKTPINGLGHGSVNLLSSGINIGIKYHFIKNKSTPISP